MPIIKKNQTLLDMACQYAGTMEQLLTIAANNNKSITEDLTAGEELLITATDLGVTNYFKKRKDYLDAVTIYLGPEVLGGIGYMKIGKSFKVT